MGIYIVGSQVAGNARPLTQAAAQNIAAALAAAGWVISAGIGYWFGSNDPEPVVDVEYEFSPHPSWKCCEHPQAGCYPDMGCDTFFE